MITHADGSCVSIANAIIRLCDFVCPHDKTKTADHDTHQWILGQLGQGNRVKKCKKFWRDSRAAPSRSAVTLLKETAPHGRR